MTYCILIGHYQGSCSNECFARIIPKYTAHPNDSKIKRHGVEQSWSNRNVCVACRGIDWVWSLFNRGRALKLELHWLKNLSKKIKIVTSKDVRSHLLIFNFLVCINNVVQSLLTSSYMENKEHHTYCGPTFWWWFIQTLNPICV